MTDLSLSLYPLPPSLPLHLSLFLSFFLSKYYIAAMIMSFCKKSVLSFLGLTTTLDHTTTTTTTTTTDHHHKLPPFRSCHHRISSLAGGLGGLITATGETQRPKHVLESSSVKSTATITPPSMKKDPCGIGLSFLDDRGGEIDGLMSCTESLGFESSDERRVDDNIEEEMNSSNINESEGFYTRRKPASRTMTTRMKVVHEVKKFPPPLSSLNKNGQPCFFLRPVRKDGRLELTEVRIDRPEILRASRQDGRLRLHLIIRENDVQDCQEEEEEDEEEEEIEQEQEEVEEKNEEVEEEIEQEQEGVEENNEEEKEEEEGVAEWKFPVSEEGFRRCHELVSHRHHNHHHHHSNHHHHLHVWSQHCVTTR